MTTIRELLIEIIESLRERLKNPIIGAFIFSWLAINWRIVLVLLYSNQTIEERIGIIEESYLNIYFNLLIPIGVATFYLGVVPYISLGFDILSNKAFKRRKEISHKRDIDEMKRDYDFDIEELKKRSEKEAEERIQSRARAPKPEVVEEKQDKQAKEKPIETESEKEKPKSSRQTASKKRRTKPQTKFTVSDQNKSSEKDAVSNFPSLRDVAMKDLAKSESEWILVYSLYSSNFGENSFTIADIRKMYRDSGRHTASRNKNVGNNMKTLVKNDLVSYLNDKEMILKEDGKQLAISILDR